MEMSNTVSIIKTAPLRAGLFVALSAFAFSSTIINIQPRGWASWYRLAVYGQEAQGRVMRRQSDNHQTCYFEYVVNSKPYESADQGCHSDVGQFVVIKYLPSDPSFSTASSPVEQLILMVLGPIALSAFGGAMTAWSISRRQRSSSQ
jgi:hypothetical protein